MPDYVPPATTCAFASVATGRDHTCAIDGNNRVWCWGLNDSGQVGDTTERIVYSPREVAIEPAMGKPVQIAAGRAFTCVRFEAGGVACWGANEAGQLGTGPSGVAPMGGVTLVPLTDPAVELGVGSDYACVLSDRDHAVVCWGSNNHLSLGRTDVTTAGLPTVVAGTEGAKRLAVGHRHNCIVDATDQVKCWGKGDHQQIGVANTDSATPTVITDLGPVNDVSAGGKTSCALEMTGAVRCWGGGHDGQIGNGTFAATVFPPPAPMVTDALSIQVGSLGACALRDNPSDNLACWGLSDVGVGAATGGSSPRTSTLEGVTQLVQHFGHTCAILGDQLECWGRNSDGQLGRGTRSSTPTPTDVPNLATVTLLAAGEAQTCAVSNGTLSCWGSSPEGQLGDGTLRTAYAPVTITTGLGAIVGITAGWHRTCAWDATGARCWGSDLYGEVGNGTPMHHVSMPTMIGSPVANVVGITLGQFHTCARSSTSAWCWGHNDAGQLGTGNTTDRLTPFQLIAPGTVSSIAAGGGHTCVVLTGSNVQCFGHNEHGQLGINSTTNETFPTSVTLSGTPLLVAAGARHTCAILTTGALYCWGDNSRGQLGLGDRTQRNLPVLVSLPAPVASLSLAMDGTCAQLTTGKVFCWGAGTHDELGIAATADALTPVEIPDLAGATKLVLASDGGCALRANGKLACWGDNLHLGTGDNSLSVPTAVPLSCR